jgi:hypothetical protein
MLIPAQGATILGAVNESHGATMIESPLSPQAIARAIGDAARADAEVFRTQILPTLSAQQGPWVPSPRPTPRAFRVYNRWTGKYVCDVSSNEAANDDLALEFPDQASADLFIQRSQGTAIARALQQPPPDDPPSCNGCWRPQVRGAVSCPHCNTTLQQPSGWVHVFSVY